MPALKLASPERQARLLQILARMSKVASAVLDPDELMRWSVDIICNELGYTFAGVFLVDESGQWAGLRIAYKSGSAFQPPNGVKLAVGGNSAIGLVTRLREPRIVQNIDEEADFVRSDLFPEACSEMALPLIVGDEVIGALSVHSLEPSAFTQEDVFAIQSIADQLAIAVKYSRMNRQAQDLARRSERRARLFQAASDVGKKVASILILDELLPKMVDIICEAYGFYYAGIFLVDENGKQAVLQAGYGEAGTAMLAKGHKLSVGGHSMIGMATSLGEARIALDVGEERVHFKNPLLPGTRSEMALPLIVGSKILGAVTVQSVEERAFSPDDILTLQTMADHLAVAIHNARLLKELDLANAELLRTKTYEALTASTTKTIHWIGNKTLPITTAVERIKTDLMAGACERDSLLEDLAIVAESARLIIEVKENLLGPAREDKPRLVMLEDVVQAAAFHAGMPARMLALENTPGMPMAIVDSTQLTRALGNLFRNSMEAGAAHISVSISPANRGEHISLSITDDGSGIPAEVRDTLWAAFVTTKGANHPGLGLPACLHIITQMHGRITASSKPGEGATFNIILPSAPEKWEKQVMNVSAGPSNIMIIDDDDTWAQKAAQILTQAGKIVIRAAGIECQIEPEPQMIWVDEAITGARISDVLEALNSKGLIGITIVVAAAMKVERTTAYLKAGVKDVALKPYTPGEILALLST